MKEELVQRLLNERLAALLGAIWMWCAESYLFLGWSHVRLQKVSGSTKKLEEALVGLLQQALALLHAANNEDER